MFSLVKMPEISKKEVKELMEKYRDKIKTDLSIPDELPKSSEKIIFSKEYKQFKREYMPKHMSWYEKACNLSEKILKIKPDEQRKIVLQKAINTLHLEITPTGVVSFAILAPIITIVFGSLIGFLLFKSLFFIFFFFLIGALLLGPLNKFPEFLASTWRLKTSNQMVVCIFYIVTFMRHTSNLEQAIEFAADHLSPPLSLDLKKILWDVETEKYESVIESLEAYLATWREYNIEFIEAFHLIESSLYESSEDRRLSMLDKSLDVILDGTYEKMLHYAQNLKSPITMLHMLGVILPILGLVILPLVVSFMEGVSWYHLAAIYNILLPIGVYYLGKNILAKRPTGYGDTDISEENPELKKYKNILFHIGSKEIKIRPLYVCIIIGIVLFLIGLSPILIHLIDPVFDIPITKNFEFIGYRCPAGELSCDVDKEIGPFGLGAAILSLLIPVGIGIAIGLYYNLKTKNILNIRNKAKQLEKEFASALFQLGNRLGDGLPPEIAFGKVAKTMQGTVSGSFFETVSMNIRKLGMGVKDAIFNPRTGALVYFPSSVIESSMKVLIQSARKGPKVAAQALTNISRYIKEIHKVDERLKDLMADVISSMKSQIKFLTPVISGIVIGITSMITTIMGKLTQQMAERTGEQSIGTFFGEGIPTYYFQIIVGIYVVQIIYILTILGNGIENGEDKLNERYSLGKNLIKAPILYAIIALIVMILFNFIASRIMSATTGAI